MSEKREHPLYEPPRGRDLSTVSASGLVPLGTCESGNRPFEACVFGGDPEGTNPPCELGNYANAPKCSFGSLASTTCYTGTAQA